MSEITPKIPVAVVAFLRGLLLAACLALTPWLAAEDALMNDFSNRPEIEKRLATVRSEISALPGDAESALRERLQQLEALCQFHLAATEVAAKARGEHEKAVQVGSEWRGFSQPPPHSILLLDEVRESLATLANSQRTAEAQLRIFAAEIEAARDRPQEDQQAERKFTEATATATAPDDRLTAERSVKLEQVASRIAAEKIARVTLRHEARHLPPPHRHEHGLRRNSTATIRGGGPVSAPHWTMVQWRNRFPFYQGAMLQGALHPTLKPPFWLTLDSPPAFFQL